MHYWNQDNFQGLKDLALALAADPRLESLAEYCRCREQGLRREAFAALDRFLTEAAGWDHEAARAACLAVLDYHRRTPKVRQFVSQPLQARFLVPVLQEWVAADPAAAAPQRWLGILTRNSELVERALTLSPDDVLARRYLVEWALYEVSHATHHLVESQFGDLEATRTQLAQARTLLELAPQREPIEDLWPEIRHYEALLADWTDYQKAPEGTFPQWCERHGRSYHWPTIIYYE